MHSGSWSPRLPASHGSHCLARWCRFRDEDTQRVTQPSQECGEEADVSWQITGYLARVLGDANT